MDTSSSSSPLPPQQYVVEPSFVLCTSEGHEFAIDLELAKRIKIVVQTMGQNLSEHTGGRVSLTKVTAYSMRDAITWMEHHRNNWDVLLQYKYGDVGYAATVSDRFIRKTWEQEFFAKMSGFTLMELAKAARELQVDLLQEACCIALALSIRNKSESQIKRFFGITILSD